MEYLSQRSPIRHFLWASLLLIQSGASQENAALPVETATVIESQIRTGYRVVGTVQPLRRSTIGAAVAGRVEEILVDLGDAVTLGQPLARLRTGTLQIELAAAQAELELAKQNLAELENGSRPEDISEAKAQAAGALATMENAARQLERLLKLSSTSAAVEADLEDAREKAVITKHIHLRLQANLDRVLAGPRPEQIAAARAQLDLRQQQVKLIEDRITKHTLLAPFDGYVSQKATEIGAWISSGDAVVEVIQLSQVEIQAPVTAEYATKIRAGDTIRVEFPELPEKLLTGEVFRVVPVADERTRTFPIMIRMENDESDKSPLLMAGMLARVEIPAGQRQILPLVPKDALVLNGRDRSVFVVDVAKGSQKKEGIARKVTVQLGVAVGDRIQVQGDIKAGEQVVVVGNERLKPDSRVSIVATRDDGMSDLSAVPVGSATGIAR